MCPLSFICCSYINHTESPRKKKDDTPGLSKGKADDEEEEEESEDEVDQLADDEDSEDQEAGEDEMGIEEEEREPSAPEKEVIRRTVRRTVTVITTDLNVVYRGGLRRSTRLQAGK